MDLSEPEIRFVEACLHEATATRGNPPQSRLIPPLVARAPYHSGIKTAPLAARTYHFAHPAPVAPEGHASSRPAVEGAANRESGRHTPPIQPQSLDGPVIDKSIKGCVPPRSHGPLSSIPRAPPEARAGLIRV